MSRQFHRVLSQQVFWVLDFGLILLITLQNALDDPVLQCLPFDAI